MKAILLAAGFGTRLKPLTDKVPKCLVPIKGIPLLQIWLETLINSGLNEFLINTHYLSDQVDFFINNSPFKKKCLIRYENILLGTAGTLLSNLHLIGHNDCLLVHADNYCLANFKDFIKAHEQRPENCLMTMMTFRADNPSLCGIVEINEENIVVGFHEKVALPPGNLANGAVYILSYEIMKIISEKFPLATDFSNEILPHFLGKIYTCETSETFIDIGTIENYKKANLC